MPFTIGSRSVNGAYAVVDHDLMARFRAGVCPVSVSETLCVPTAPLSSIWFTSSTSFANPAVTLGQAFTDTFAGIAPSSVPAFIAAQLVGLAVGLALVAVLFGRPAPTAEDVVVPHTSTASPPPAADYRPAPFKTKDLS